MNLSPVLLIGATGSVGSKVARHLRASQPDLPLVLGSRNAERGKRFAEELGNAAFEVVDLADPGLGLPDRQFSAVIALVKENTLNPLRLAEACSAAYLSMADGSFEIAPTIARHAARPDRAAIVLASHWAAGMGALLTRAHLRSFRSVDRIELVAIMDPSDPIGPMAEEDVTELMRNSPRPQMLHDGRWKWAGDDLASRQIVSRSGQSIDVHAMSVLDTASLAAATDAQLVRFDFASSPTELRDGSHAHELVIEIAGERDDGRAGVLRTDLLSFQGVSGLTALGVALGVERALGLSGGAPLSPGLHFVDQIVDPAHAMDRFLEHDGQIAEKRFLETGSLPLHDTVR